MAIPDEKALLQKFAGTLADFGEWLAENFKADAFGQQRALNALADDLGGTVKPGAPMFAPPALDGIQKYRDAAKPDLESWLGVISDVKALYESIRAISGAIDLGAEAATEEVVQSVLDLLAGNYVRDRWPQLHAWMEFARFSTEPATLFGPQGTAGRRFAGSVKALLKFALAPLKTLGGPPMQTEADARNWSDSTLIHLAGILAFLGKSAREIGLDTAPEDEWLIKTFYGWDQPPELRGAAADDISDRMLSLQVMAPPQGFGGGRVKLEGALRSSVTWIPAAHAGRGFFVSFGASALRGKVRLNKKWAVETEARFDAPFGVQIGGPETFRAETPIGEFELHADVSLASTPVNPGEYGFRFTVAGDNGLSIGRATLSASINRDAAQLQLSLYDCRFALDGAAFDNFIGSLLPSTQTAIEFSFGIGASTKGGLFTTGDLPFASGRGGGPQPSSAMRRAAPPGRSRRGALRAPAPTPAVVPPPLPVLSTNIQGSGIPIQIPVGKSVGPVRLHHVLLNLDRDTSGEAPKTLIAAAISFSAKIGPVEARVDRIGLKFAVDFPDDASKANLHFANVDLGFLPPAGIGLAVDADSVKGGGFLFHDAAKHQYAGVMELSLSGVIALKAIGLLSTRLPDGSKGYSLVVIVTAESSDPDGELLKLPMAWRLTGIGGLLAIHRTVNEEALREGLKNRTLESILFPKDPVRNAPTIIAALERVFPPKRGSYLLGLMVRLAWGTPTIITVDVGLILELGARHRFILIGRVSSILPHRKHDLLRLNLEAVGIFDFDEGTVSIDAVLVDSRLLNRFPITGSAALRARWTSPRSFALAVGGMNKGFNPPAGFPKLERVTLSLTTGDNPRLTCEGYFALTANTVQYGARAHLYAAAHGFNVEGEAGYDVLIQLVPFHFLAEFFASMQLRKGSRSLFKVKVEGALEGPIPLSVRAKCTFEILWWDVSIRVNVTLAGGQRPPAPAAVSAFDALRTALSDAHNWNAELPAGQTLIVKLRDTSTAGEVRVHPLGTLAVRQGVVPLNLARDIDKFGEAPVAGARRFSVSRVAIEGATQRTNPVQDDFAPGQFFEMTDDARLASPSFEPMQAGLRIGEAAFTFGFDDRAESPLEFETRVVDRFAAVEPPPPSLDYRLSDRVLLFQALHGAAGRSVLRRGEPAAFAPFARVEETRWAAVTADLKPAAAQALTFAEAVGRNTRDVRKRLVVREFEAVK